MLLMHLNCYWKFHQNNIDFIYSYSCTNINIFSSKKIMLVCSNFVFFKSRIFDCEYNLEWLILRISTKSLANIIERLNFKFNIFFYNFTNLKPKEIILFQLHIFFEVVCHLGFHMALYNRFLNFEYIIQSFY